MRVLTYSADNTPSVFGPVLLNESWQFPPDAKTYTVFVDQAVGGNPLKMVTAQVFEVIGSDISGQQSAQLSPEGLRLTSDDGGGVIDLTTSSDQFLSIQKRNLIGVFETQASIDSDGDSLFRGVSVNDDISILGTPLVGDFASAKINGALPPGALLDRLGRGVVGYATFGGDGDPLGTTALVQALGAGKLLLEPDRAFSVSLDLNGVARWLTPGISANLELQIWLGPNPQDLQSPQGIQLGWQFLDQQIPVNQFAPIVAGTPTLPIVGLGGMTYFLIRLVQPTNRQYETYINGSMGPGRFQRPAAMSILDIGPANSLANLGDVKLRTNSGEVQPVVPASGPSLVRTQEWGAQWWRSFSGDSVITGTGQWTNSQKLYQGATGAGMKTGVVGFPPFGLGGRYIHSARVLLSNEHFYMNSGGTALLGLHSQGGPGGRPGRSSPWDVGWRRGESKWVDIPAQYLQGLANGSIRGFTVGGVNNSSNQYYGYFGGSNARISITYQ